MGYMSTDHPREGDPEANGAISPPAAFPLDLALQGLKVNILDAEASMKEDEDRIEGWVGSRAREVNRVLRNKFALPAIRGAYKQDDPELLCKTIEDVANCTAPADFVAIIDSLQLVSGIIKQPASPEKIRVLKTLVQHGWDPNSVTDKLVGTSSRRPLGNALECEDYESARLLLEAGADPRKMGADDIVRLSPGECPEDIRSLLEESGVLKRRVCLRLCRPCRCCWGLMSVCCCMFLNPCWYKAIFLHVERNMGYD